MKNILIAVALIAFLCTLGFVGSCERGLITLTECIWKSLIHIGVSGISVYLLNRYDD